MKNTVVRLLALVTALLITASPITVQASASKSDTDTVLRVHISTSEEDGSLPLANIILDLYKTDLQPGSQGTAAEVAAQYKTRENLVATLVTDGQGWAECNLTQAGQPNGVYLIVQQHNPAAAGEGEALCVTVSGGVQTVYFKRVPEKTPNIQTDVATIQQKSGSFDIGQQHIWILRGTIPAGISNAVKYRITDILDYRLSYQKGSPVVTLFCCDGKEIPLEEKYYTLVEETQSRSGKMVDAFHIALTPEGMSYVAANQGKGSEKSEIRVRFQAAINCNATMGATVPNDSHLDYTNSAGVVYHADSDIPEVHTGGIHILKTDKEGTPLSGSEFMIAREATQAEMEDETLTKEVLHIGGKNLAVVYLDFYAEDLQGEKQFTAVTDTEGKAAVYGLAYGTYYLVETKAPEGYGIVTQPMEIEVSETSHIRQQDGWRNINGEIVDNTLKVVNTKFVFPDTGGFGTAGFTAVGILLICAACVLLLSNRNKKF